MDESPPIEVTGRDGAREPSRAGGSAAGASVLVADDDDDSRVALRVLLESYGHVVHEAEDGSEALRKARRLHPDLILLDLVMPGMDGLEAARRIRRQAGLRDTPMVCVSAMDGAREAAASAGFDDCLRKPIDVERFRRRVERWLAAS